MKETLECDRVLCGADEPKARVDVRDKKDQMATGQEARTGRPEAVLQCSLGLQRQL